MTALGGVDSYAAVCIEVVRNSVANNISSYVFSENCVVSALEIIWSLYVDFKI